MNHRDLLFEIGCEDLPPLQINAAVEGLAEAFRAAAADARINHGEIHTFATPRRLTILVEGVAEQQRDLEEMKVGPPVTAAFDEDGNPTRALLGFAKGHGVSPDELTHVTQTRRNKEALYVAAVIKERGQRTPQLLPELLAALPGQIQWPKPMRWGHEPQAFARPVHWMVALFGEDVVRLRFAGVVSGRSTQGHRFHFPDPVELTTPADYEQTLRDRRVIASFTRRRTAIEKLAHAAAEHAGGVLVADEPLLDEVTQLVEWPVAILGEFDRDFLDLPHKVLQSSMRKHQRYFAMVDNDDNMLPGFITISNTAVNDPDLVAHGNRRVLRARLKDAEFFFREDQKRPLAAYNETLKRVAFLKGLGSVYDKALRIEAVASWVAADLGLDEEKVGIVARAARLCKADLCTQMVGEFPDLQGFIGGEYARRGDEHLAVARAIAEHYAPRGARDNVARSPGGAIVSIADRIDSSIAALFSVGKIPTGAADPFALRRAALGLVRTLIKHNYKLHLPSLVEQAVHAVAPDAESEQKQGLSVAIQDFIATRMRHYFSAKFPAEVIDAVLALGDQLEDVPATLARVQALAPRYSTPEFEPIGVTFKRAANILDDDAQAPVDPSLLSDDAEKALFEAIEGVREQLDPLVEARDFGAAIDLLVTLRPAVDLFFDEVLVNADDATVRANRHALLRDVLALLGRVADVRRL